MKTTLRIFAFTVALTGLITSSFSSPANTRIPSHLAAFSAAPGPLGLPIPTCDPSVPTCGNGVTINNSLNF